MTDTSIKQAAFGADRKIRVDAKRFAAAHIFSSHEITRYYLNGVYVEPHPDGGVIMIATDGHKLGAVLDPDGYADAPSICYAPAALVSACGKRPKSIEKNPGDLHFLGNTAFLTAKAFRAKDGEDEPDPRDIGRFHIWTGYAPAIDGAYPDYRRVLPTGESVKQMDFSGGAPWFSVNGDYVKPFADAVKLIMDVKFTPGLTFVVTDRASPIGIHSESVPSFFGVLMPLRAHSSRPEIPAWINPKKDIAA